LRCLEDDFGLVARRGRGVHLGAAFAIRCKGVEPDARAERRFSIAARHLDVSLAKAPKAGLLDDPPEDRAEDELLPWFERNTAARQRPLDVRQELNEGADLRGTIGIEPIGIVLVLGFDQVIEMSLAGEPNKLAGKHVATDDSLRVTVSIADMV